MAKQRNFSQRVWWALTVILTAQMQMLESAARKSPIEIQFTAATMDYKNPDYLERSAYVRVVRKSRNASPVFEASLPFIRDVPLDANYTFQAFQKINNAWRSTIVKGTVKLCRALESKSRYERLALDSSDFPKKCPIKKGNYTIKDYRLDSDILPGMIPPGEWRNRFVFGTPAIILYTFTADAKVINKELGRRPAGSTGMSLAAIDWGKK